MRYINIISFVIVLTALLGCISSQERRDSSVYDFGLTAPSNAPVNVIVQDVSAPAWLATPALHYRLAYHDVAQLKTYANSRWAADPASLLTLRLRQSLGNNVHGKHQYQLRVALEEFSQVFDSPENSRGVIRARAYFSVIGESDSVSSRAFSVERKAQTPYAEGGAHALAEASNQLTEEIGKWLTEATAETCKKNK